MTALVITATLGFMILLILIDTYRTNAKIKRMVRESWGKPPVTRFRKDRLESVETYWEEKKLRLGHGRYVDDITWNDLDMDLIFSQLNSTFSSVGAEYMYARLHELCFDQAELQAFDELVGALDTAAVEREQIAFRLGKLGKNDFNSVSDFIFASSDKHLSNMWMYFVLGFLPLCGKPRASGGNIEYRREGYGGTNIENELMAKSLLIVERGRYRLTLEHNESIQA